jgi:hypothetical protein
MKITAKNKEVMFTEKYLEENTYEYNVINVKPTNKAVILQADCEECSPVGKITKFNLIVIEKDNILYLVNQDFTTCASYNLLTDEYKNLFNEI